MITIFTETEQGNYVSTGSKGKTFAASTEDGWVSGTIPLDSDKYPTDGLSRYQTPQEALRAVSAKKGYKIDGEDTRQIGVVLTSR